MCHGQASAALPASAPREVGTLQGIATLIFGPAVSNGRIAIIPDIYGTNVFYRGLATHFGDLGAEVFLVDPFDGLGELPEPTREAAFARRHQLRDKDYVDRLEEFIRAQRLSGVLGFCLGGLYVFELARRDVPVTLVGLYGFPQGLANADPLPVPFDYLATVTRPHAALFGNQDASLGPENLERMRALAATTPSLSLDIFAGSAHGFLGDIDDADADRRSNAANALKICEAALIPRVLQQ
jgi:carboxymethylenebutenolidase